MSTVRLTMTQALARGLAAQRTVIDGKETPIVAGVWAIFGHGNVAALGEALWQMRETLPTFRGHNEQAMALAAVGFARASRRRRFMACASSIGPGATNMVTAAATAHINRLPLLLLPADAFAGRRPDPVLQQVESFADATLSANDCLRPVSRYFDRICRPEQILDALPRAMATLTDPAACGPATLALCQDAQAEAFDCPRDFLEPRVWTPRRPPPDADSLAAVAAAFVAARRPLLVAGGGAFYADAGAALAAFAERHGVPVVETQAGKGALPGAHPLNLGGVGVSGSAAANALAAEADLVLAVGSRLTDIITGSRTLLPGRARLVGLNVNPADAARHGALPLVADAAEGLERLSERLGGRRAASAWLDRAAAAQRDWDAARSVAIAPGNAPLPSDAQIVGAVRRATGPDDVVVAAAGGLPGELHKFWRAGAPGGYHVEYGYSCMGYEIAGGLGVKMALPDRRVIVLVGDGSWLMMNSEIATSVALGLPLTVVLLDNRGFACIDRLQRAAGGRPFNNLFESSRGGASVAIDFAAHARALGARARKVASVAELEAALSDCAAAPVTTVLVIETDPAAATEAGGHWWDVPVPAVSPDPGAARSRDAYEAARGV